MPIHLPIPDTIEAAKGKQLTGSQYAAPITRSDMLEGRSE
jgi:hypothetical protein